MSALRNAVQRRNHKERAQPHERSKWGLLEKHKDYSLRAKDHNAKKRKIQALQAKAASRNEDEFYFGMINGQTRGGIKIAKRGQENSGSVEGAGKPLSQDVLKLMKTQDAAYLRTVLSSTKREKERLHQEITTRELGLSADKPDTNSKILFNDDGRPMRKRRKVIKQDELRTSLDNASGSDENDEDHETLESAAKTSQRILEKQQKRLHAVTEQEKSLTFALQEVEDQRGWLNGKGRGVNKHGVRFKTKQRLQR